MVFRKDVEAAKAMFYARLGDEYVYGGMFTQNPKDGTDCSGLWNDMLGMAVGRFKWGREAEGATTESYRYITVGGVGPFGTIRVAKPSDIPANAVAKLAFHHEGSGGAASHMWGELDGVRMESAGSKGLVTAPAAWTVENSYANAWAYLPGPIVEDGTNPGSAPEPADTLFADVSEWQVPVDDSYPYRVLSIRVSDGTYRDKNFAKNYAWMQAALNDGRLAFGIIYTYVRPDWQSNANTVRSMIDAAGGLHPRVALMLDVESGGNPAGDGSSWINSLYSNLVDYVGDARRIIGYGNTGDLNSIWRTKPAGIRLVVAGYGNLPTYAGMIAHQYTDGNGYGGGLPEGAAPFGNCDMNAANGLTATAFAAALGITVTNSEGDNLTPEQNDKLLQIWGALFNPITSLSKYRADGEGAILTTKDEIRNLDAMSHEALIERNALLGNPEAIALVKREADKGDPWAGYVLAKCPTVAAVS